MSGLVNIPAGVVVERSKSASQWADYYWRPVSVLAGAPASAPWTKLTDDGERATFYAGAAEIALHRSDTGNYRDNLSLAAPLLWIIMQPAEGDPPLQLVAVTADPSEGEAMTEAGVNLVEAVPMPKPIAEVVAAFVAQYHVEQEFVKRKRDRANPEALGRRVPPPERR